jgi:GWxTD domain-containing protein
MKKILILIFIAIFAMNAEDKFQNDSDNEFLLDAIVFKGDSVGKSRLDIFVVVPYKSLEFIKSGDIYGSKYDVFIDVYNVETNEVLTDNYSRVITAEDYFIASGGSAEFDYNQNIYYLEPGDYRMKIIVHDKISNREYTRSRRVSVIDFNSFDLSLSGIMLVSSIEENNGKYKINPHISDNIGKIENDFFAFFECYNFKGLNEIPLVYQITDKNDKVVQQGEVITEAINDGSNRLYMKIDSPGKLSTGVYSLRIIALKENSNDFSEQNYLAVAQRSVKIEQSLIGNLLEDIDNAIRQLRYAAFQEEIDKIKDAPNRAEKEKRFMEFWKSKDPSPNTDRNEAFNQYYNRINYANRNFKSYTEGWMTDKGMVYVIYGPPYSAERQNRYGDNRVYEIWRYNNNREFVFIDNTGFGDFRLIRPATIVEKYEYRN